MKNEISIWFERLIVKHEKKKICEVLNILIMHYLKMHMHDFFER